MAQMKEFIVEGKNQQPTRVATHPILGSQKFTASNMDIRNGETTYMPPPGAIAMAGQSKAIIS
jgi:hypothetical protein